MKAILRIATSFSIVVVLCLCVLKSGAENAREFNTGLTNLDVLSLEEGIKTADDKEPEVALEEANCDCGPNSKGCKIENGNKICQCKDDYKQVNDLCKGFCKEDWQCDNGAKCVNQSCQCPPGTSGDFCKTVDACAGMKGPLMCGDPDKVLCWYDRKAQKPYCMCRILDFIYYPKTRDCIECDCGNYGTCSLVDGKKQCKCNDDAALRKVVFWGDVVDRCDVCNCGENSDNCSFEGFYNQVCKCKKGYAQQPDIGGEKCNKCDCGPNGQCYFKGWYQYCNCDAGYSPFLNKNKTKLTCEACDCGKNGVCSFEEEEKQCKCNPGYAERDGICTACQCYAGNDTVPCTFTNKIQKCLCPDGYLPTKFICEDVNECRNSSNSCPSTTECVNTMGSYECVCKEGYEPLRSGSDPKEDGCQDINECEDVTLCPRIHTLCYNTLGSYTCTCEKGFVPLPPFTAPKDAGCTEEIATKGDSSPWKTGLIVLGVLIGMCIITIAIFIRRRSIRRPPLRMDTTLNNMR